MRNLTNPILHDVARILARHPDLSPDYKTQLLQGLDQLDHELEIAVAIQTDRAIEKPKVKR